eukprot:Tbor_TRINITY_DN5025_c0_g1::TRINITY_DN5025_c0_g1_i2::g.14051::m.14051
METPNKISTTATRNRGGTTPLLHNSEVNRPTDDDIQSYITNGDKHETRRRKRDRESKLTSKEKINDVEREVISTHRSSCTPSPSCLTDSVTEGPCESTPFSDTTGVYYITIYLYTGWPAQHALRIVLPIRSLACTSSNTKRRRLEFKGQPEVIQIPASAIAGSAREELPKGKSPTEIHHRSIAMTLTGDMQRYYLLHLPSIILPSGKSLHDHLQEEKEESENSISPAALVLRKVKEGWHGKESTRVLMLPGPSEYSIVEDGGYYALEGLGVKD